MQLGISERQAQRLINRYRVSGAEGLVSRKRGQPSNRRLTESLKLRVLTLIRENYSDFGPTLAAEKLRERHNIRLSIETVRNWMTSRRTLGPACSPQVTGLSTPAST